MTLGSWLTLSPTFAGWGMVLFVAPASPASTFPLAREGGWGVAAGAVPGPVP